MKLEEENGGEKKTGEKKDQRSREEEG